MIVSVLVSADTMERAIAHQGAVLPPEKIIFQRFLGLPKAGAEPGHAREIRCYDGEIEGTQGLGDCNRDAARSLPTSQGTTPREARVFPEKRPLGTGGPVTTSTTKTDGRLLDTQRFGILRFCRSSEILLET